MESPESSRHMEMFVNCEEKNSNLLFSDSGLWPPGRGRASSNNSCYSVWVSLKFTYIISESPKIIQKCIQLPCYAMFMGKWESTAINHEIWWYHVAPYFQTNPHHAHTYAPPTLPKWAFRLLQGAICRDRHLQLARGASSIARKLGRSQTRKKKNAPFTSYHPLFGKCVSTFFL